MLQSIRDNISGWIAWVVVILLSIPFALVGISSYFGGVSSNAVAEVGGEEISRQVYQNRYQQQYQQIRRIYGEQFDPEMIDEERMREQVLDQMIREELLVQRARELGYHASEEAIVEQIRNVPAFQVSGEFSMERYRAMLRNQGMSASELERSVGRDILGNLMRQGVMNSAIVTDWDITRMAALESQVRQFDELRIGVDAFRDQVSVDDEAVRSYYEANIESFMTEPAADLAYLELSMEEVRDEVEISEDAIRSTWEERRQEYLADEERLARHILIPVEDSEEAARQRAQELKTRIDQGADFTEVAREESADSASAEEGGSLGWVYQGDMAGPVDEAIFSMEPGTVSEPIRSEFGFHLVRVDEVSTPEPLPYEEARDEILADLRASRAEELFFDRRERLADATFSNPESLTAVADELGLEVERVEGVTPESGEGIASNPAVRDAAFSPSVRDERLNSDPIELGDNQVVVLRVERFEPSTEKPLASVSEEIRQTLLAQRAREQATALADELLSALQDGTSVAELGEREGVELSEGRSGTRNSDELDRGIRRALFRMPRPAEDPASYERVERADGDFAVLALREVVSETPELAEEDTERRRRSLSRSRANSEFNAFVRELRRVMDVTMSDSDSTPTEPEQG